MFATEEVIEYCEGCAKEHNLEDWNCPSSGADLVVGIR